MLRGTEFRMPTGRMSTAALSSISLQTKSAMRPERPSPPHLRCLERQVQRHHALIAELRTPLAGEGRALHSLQQRIQRVQVVAQSRCSSAGHVLACQRD